MNKRIASVVVAGGILMGCSGESGPEQAAPTTPEVTQPTYDIGEVQFSDAEIAQRQEQADHWVEQARAVAETAGDELSEQLILMLDDAGLAAPVASEEGLALQHIEVSETGAPSIVPVFQEDLEVLPSSIFENAAAVYNPDFNMLLIRADGEFTDTYGGIMMLHEAKHALDYITEPYDWEDGQTFSYYEADTHSYQNFLMQQVGGDSYKEVIDNYTAEIMLQIKVGPEGLEIPERTDYMKELDGIFGPAASQLERDTRQTHVWIHGLFNAFDSGAASQDEAFELKSQFLHSRYIDSDIVSN